ncbi:MAG: hypothetical protein PHS79_00615 [Patescibacteria group bacterium]|nr:hypothetical protein [Patescibacteria group bacterium]
MPSPSLKDQKSTPDNQVQTPKVNPLMQEVKIPKTFPAWAIVLIFVAGIAIGFGVFWAVMKYTQLKTVSLLAPEKTTENQPPEDVVIPTSTQPIADDGSQPTKNEYADYILSPIKDSEVLNMSWRPPVRRDPSVVFGGVLEANRMISLYSGDIIDRLNKALDQLKNDYNQSVSETSLGTWELGVVADGKYKGYKLFEHREDVCEMGGCADFRFLISVDGKRALIMDPLNLELMKSYRGNDVDYRGRTYMEWERVVTPAFGLNIVGEATLPKELLFNGKKLLVAEYLGWDNVYPDWLKTEGKMTGYEVFGKTDDGLTVYGTKQVGCVYVQMPNRYFVRVASKIPEGDAPVSDEFGVRPLKINWDRQALGDKKVSEIYIATGGGCETFCPVLVEEGENVGETALLKVGTTSDGGPIYIPKDPSNSKTIKAAYDTWFLTDGKTKPSFDEFLKQMPVPMFFWKDAFGRWQRYSDVNLSPPAECGKPVIYLYPKQNTIVSVALPKFINVTVSEPKYPAGGWKVFARPDGTMNIMPSSTHATTTYSSLYWEGTGVGYATPKDGFVVKDGQRKSFLLATLPKYGLNATETREFVEFWLPKLTGSPYYRISFLTDTWSKAAPLYVKPAPQTSIRIFMDWQKLSSPIKIAAPRIVTPVRNGFTLVEWGGLIYN